AGTHEVQIRATGTVDGFNAGPRERVRTYSFEAPGWGRPACQPATSWMEDFTATTPASSFDPATPTPAVLVIGELYDPRSAEVELRIPRPGRWLNVACAGGALSKMRLMGLDPTRPSSSPDERQATLKMITAKYCGTTSYTENGVPLFWTSLAGKTEPSP